jgi:hypothetical protein
MAGHADRNLEKEQFWRQVVKGHAGSGLSIRQYCADRGVSQPSFFAWRRELARRDSAGSKQAKSSPKRAKPKSKRQPPVPQRFAQLQIAPVELAGGACIEIVLPAGTRVRVPRGACPATLQNVLVALERRAC